MGKSSKASVPMIHSVPELKVSEELAKKLGRADTDRLLGDRKLALLVDLDQTIIHTTNDNVPNNLKDVYHFQLYGPNSPWFHVRLRPGTLNFLKTIEEKYELHICTFGARNYAHMICAFLDENGRLFSHRILSRDECLNATRKNDNLKALFPDDCADSMVCIIDDREDVWNYAKNLIQVKPYHFFQTTGDINAPEGLTKRELDGKGVDFNKIVKLQKAVKKVQTPKSDDDTKMSIDAEIAPANNVEEKSEENNSTEITQDKEDGECSSSRSNGEAEADDNLVEIEDPDDYLLYLETILKKIHERFYEQYEKTGEIPDLKKLIPQLKSEILVGVEIVFSGLVPNNVKLEYSRPYLVAKNMGANVSNSITDETTHLVAASSGTQKVFQAQKSKKISIVTPDWLWTCAERWERVEEKLFPLTSGRSHKIRAVPAHCSPERINEEQQNVKFNNPFLQMSDDDIASMEAEVTDSSSDTDSDDEREDEDNTGPGPERVVRKRKRSESLTTTSKVIQTIDISGGMKEKEDGAGESDSSGSGKSGKSSDSETLVSKFRRGKT